MRYEVKHTTTYEYSALASVSHHLMRLNPRTLPHQRCLAHELVIEPRPAVTKTHIDYFGNKVAFVTVEGGHRRLECRARNEVEVKRPPLPHPSETSTWESVRDLCRGQQIGETLEASEFLFNSPYIKSDETYAEYAAPSFPKERPILEAMLDLTKRINTEFTFDSKATTLATPLEEVLKNRRGVCQDFAHFQIACLRSLGLPARYVSGYLETDSPPGQPRLTGADASHAWVSFFCAGIGWIDLDPTNNVIPTVRHVTLAWGRDFSDVSPIRGVVLGGGNHTLKVAVDVVRVDDNGKSAKREGVTI